MPRHTDVIIIGAGQAGLAMSHCLSQRGIEHVVLERGRVGERWLSERWPSLRLLSPNGMIRLPGLPVPAADPAGFMAAADYAATLSGYAARIGAPLVTGCEVLAVSRAAQGGFRVESSAGAWTTRAVVIATGACDRPAVPAWAAGLPAAVAQVTTSDYRGPEALPEGGVLVVGASSTGVQLAAEIRASGRPVTLAVGAHVRAPRRYRGRDLYDWLDESGFLYEPRAPGHDPARLMAMPSLQLVGSEDGRDIGLAALAEAGIRIAGRALGVADGRVRFAPTLGADCAAAEARRQTLLSAIDRHIAAAGLDVPDEPEAWRAPPPPSPGPEAVDLAAEGIRTVVWATGFRRAHPWLKLPVLDGSGEIVNAGGETPVTGLYVLGLPFMRQRSSAFIYGVGRDAEALAASIDRRLSHPQPLAA
jgi:putative flavoprotein involved in K+ transport